MAEEVYTKTATDILKTIRKTVFIPMTDNNWSYTEQNQMLQVCNYATVIQHRVMAITEIKQENTVSEAETAELKEAFNMLYDLWYCQTDLVFYMKHFMVSGVPSHNFFLNIEQ